MDDQHKLSDDGTQKEQPIWLIWVLGLFLVFPGSIAYSVLKIRAIKSGQSVSRLRKNYSRMRLIYMPTEALIFLLLIWAATQSVGTVTVPSNNPTTRQTPAPTYNTAPTLSKSIVARERKLCNSYHGVYSDLPNEDNALASCTLKINNGTTDIALFNAAGQAFVDPCLDYTWATEHGAQFAYECTAPAEPVATARSDCLSGLYYPSTSDPPSSAYAPAIGPFKWYAPLDICMPKAFV